MTNNTNDPKRPDPANRIAEELAAFRLELAAAKRVASQAAQVAKQASVQATEAVRVARGTGDHTAAAIAARRGAAEPKRPATPPAAQPPEPVKTRVGDNGPTPELAAAVRALISERPRTFAELLEETGARQGRVSGVLVRLQTDDGAVNLGKANRAVWFLPSAEVMARLRGAAARRR